MKNYIVEHDTIIEGRPINAGETVSLSVDTAKAYKSAGLIKNVDGDNDDDLAKGEEVVHAKGAKSDKKSDANVDEKALPNSSRENNPATPFEGKK